MRVYVRLALLLGVAGVLLLSGGETVAAPGGTRQVSVSSAGGEGDGGSEYPAISADGRYVAFHSSAANLVPGDTNPLRDVFVRDRLIPVTERVSVKSNGDQSNSGDSVHPAISADGRHVAFDTFATDLVPGDTQLCFLPFEPYEYNCPDVLAHDRVTGATVLISLSSGGAQGDGDNMFPDISGDGRYVAFQSPATNLVAGDTNVFCQNDPDPELDNCGDIFVRDRDTDVDGIFDEPGAVSTVRVSVSTSGTQGNEESHDASISMSGRFVVFTSAASNLVASDTNGHQDIFLRDRDTDVDGIFDETGAVSTVRVSVRGSSTQGNGDSDLADVSSDGRYVVFSSDATNLVTGDTNGQTDVFVRDRDMNTTIRLSLSSGGVQGNNWSYAPAISSDGALVAFVSQASNLEGVPNVFCDYDGDTVVDDNCIDVFVRDRDTDHDGIFDEPGWMSTVRVSVSTSGDRGNAESLDPAISGDGRFVAFESSASNLVPEDTNGYPDVFVRDRQTPTPSTERVSVGLPVGGIAELPPVSGSSASDYVPLAGLAAGALALLSAGAWFARRRSPM
jgi:Tol biopolymer transport system component